MTDTDKKPKQTALKPLQSISYAEKIKDDNDWGKQNIDYLLSQSSFTRGINQATGGVKTWFDAYNSRLDAKKLTYVTNPLNAKNDLYSKFPAKLRFYNIIRPNIDLLIGEWNKKPFKFDVINTDGEGVLDAYTAAQTKVFKDNITKRFVNLLNQQSESGLPSEDIPDPATVIDSFNVSYKDNQAIEGYKSLRTLEFDLKLKAIFKNCFKDWCIGGTVQSIKFPTKGEIDYRKLSSLSIDFDKSTDTSNIEDGNWATAKFDVPVSDLVDMFYDKLKESDLMKLEEDEGAFRSRIFGFLTGSGSDNTQGTQTLAKDLNNKVNLYYACWKSRRKIGFLSYIDPLTLREEETVVDENYKVDKEAGETVVWMWVNEVWEGWRINDDLYIGIQPAEAQRSELYNFSACKLPINGRRFSDTESDNVSLVQLGMPFQLMYIILMYRVELLIAKSKGKIVPIEKNTIPDYASGGEEKFLYQSEALGYMLVDHDQEGVNPRLQPSYQVIDLSLFDQIAQLIKIATSFKDQWDELLGINRQRKGQSQASDGLGVSEQSIFRSTVISDIVFSTFDEWIESELQGLIDLSKFAWIDGKKGHYQTDDGRLELINLDGEKHANSSYGVFVDAMGRMADKLALLKANVNAIAQRKDIKVSTIADLIFTDSYAELTAKLKKAEAVEEKANQILAQNQQEAEKAVEETKKEYLYLENMLNTEFMEKQQDRLDVREYIKGEVKRMEVTGEGINIDSLISATNARIAEVNKNTIEREKIRSKERIERMKDATKKEEIKASLKNKVVGEA